MAGRKFYGMDCEYNLTITADAVTCNDITYKQENSFNRTFIIGKIIRNVYRYAHYDGIAQRNTEKKKKREKRERGKNQGKTGFVKSTCRTSSDFVQVVKS